MLLDNALNQLGMGIPSSYEVQHPSTALGMVAAGAGITILPRLTLRRAAYARIRAIPLVSPVVHRELGLIHRGDVTLSPAALALYETIRKNLSAPARD
jgi:DNA-binding transcriptional LysR family regulator